MKILLTGRNGQVGWELERALQPLGTVFATDRATLDLANEESLRRVIREVKPDTIVNAAAYTAVDKAESEPDLAMRINGVAPGVMAEEAKRLGALLVHYSTDYVFDGHKTLPYTEDDRPNPLSVYGRSKLQGDMRIISSGCRALVLRTSWVYGARGKNFYLTILRKVIAGEPLRVVNDQRGVPTASAFVAERTIDLIRKNAGGVFNVVPSGETTWFGFARAIASAVRLDADIQRIRTGEFPAAAVRPANSVLDNRKLAALLGEPLPPWQVLLRSVRESRPS